MKLENRRFVRAHEAILETSPWTENEWLCRPGLVEAERLLLLRATLPPFHCHPFHHHPHREEILHVLSGRAEQWVGLEHRILEPGDSAHIPAGMVHATYNPFDAPLVFLAILSPAKLTKEQAADGDPVDVSLQNPWSQLRHEGLPCRTLGLS